MWSIGNGLLRSLKKYIPMFFFTNLQLGVLNHITSRLRFLALLSSLPLCCWWHNFLLYPQLARCLSWYGGVLSNISFDNDDFCIRWYKLFGYGWWKVFHGREFNMFCRLVLDKVDRSYYSNQMWLQDNVRLLDCSHWWFVILFFWTIFENSYLFF